MNLIMSIFHSAWVSIAITFRKFKSIIYRGNNKYSYCLSFFQLARMQMDDITDVHSLYAIHSSSILPKILHYDPSWIGCRARRWTTLVCQMYLSHSRFRSLRYCFRSWRWCSCHQIFWSIFHVLSDGTGLGEPYFIGWYVFLSNDLLSKSCPSSNFTYPMIRTIHYALTQKNIDVTSKLDENWWIFTSTATYSQDPNEPNDNER